METTINSLLSWPAKARATIETELDKLVQSVKHGVFSAILAPFRFVWHILGWLAKTVFSLGCLFVGAPLAVVAFAVMFGMGWWTLLVVPIVMLAVAPIALVLQLIWVFVKHVFLKDTDIEELRTARKKNRVSGWLLIGIIGLCSPLAPLAILVLAVVLLSVVIEAVKESQPHIAPMHIHHG